MALNKRILLMIVLIMPLSFCFAQNDAKTSSINRYCISDIQPRSAIIKINGELSKLGTIFKNTDTIEMPSNAVIRVKELGSQKHSVIKGGKLIKLPVKTLARYKQLNSKGTQSLEAIRNFLNQDNWLMMSDTAFIDFPAKLSSDEYFIFKSIPKLIEFKPTFNYDNGEITITKADLINWGIYNYTDSIIQFQVEVHNSEESLFVTDSLKIKYIPSN